MDRRDFDTIQFPLKGLHDTFAAEAQPAGTTRVMQNVTARNGRNGEYTGAQRQGTEAFVDATLGSGPVHAMVSVVYDSRQTTYTVADAAEDLKIVGSWQNPALKSTQRVITDRAGNIYGLSGETAIAKWNPDGELLTQMEVPVEHRDQRLRALDLDDDGAIYVGTSQGPQGARSAIWRYLEVDDNEYQIAWSETFDGYIPDFVQRDGLLYVLENIAERPLPDGLPSNLFGIAYLHVYDSIDASAPRLLWSRAVPFPAAQVAVNAAGVIYVACGPNSQRGIVTGDSCSPHSVWWTPDQLSSATSRIWAWFDASDLADGIGSLTEGDPVRFWRDRSNNNRNLFYPGDRTAGVEPPTYEPAGMCDLPVVRFNGRSALATADTVGSNADNSAESNLSIIPSINNETFTLFMVLAPRAGSATRQCVFEQWGEARYRILVNDINGAFDPGTIRIYVEPVNDAAGPGGQPGHGSIHADVPSGYRDDVVIVAFRMGGDDASESSFLRVNGVEVDRFTINRDQIRYSSALGYSADPNSPYDGSGFEGDFAEILTIRGAMSDAEIERIEGYLGNKWGMRHVLGGSGSGSHPFEGGPPSGTGSPSDPGVEDPWAEQLKSQNGIVLVLSPNAGDVRWVCTDSGVGDMVACDDEGRVWNHGRPIDSGASAPDSTPYDSGSTDITTRLLFDKGDSFDFGFAISELVIPRNDYLTRMRVDRAGNLYIPGHVVGSPDALRKVDVDGNVVWTFDVSPIQRVAYDVAFINANKVYDDDDTIQEPEYLVLCTFQGGPGNDNATAASHTIWKIRNVEKSVSDGSPREQAVYAVCDGSIHRVRRGASPEVDVPTGGSGVMDDSRFANGVPLYGEIFYSDGGKYLVVNPRKHEVTPYKARSAGAPIENARLLFGWRGALGWARPDDNPHQWMLSKRGNPYDVNLFPPRATAIDAILGSDSRAGVCPDIIQCVMPWSDDLCIFLCENSIQRLTGDPADNGVFDLLTDKTGCAFGMEAACKGPSGEIYFLSQEAEIWVLTPGGSLTALTDARIRKRLQAIDLTLYRPVLGFDLSSHSLHVFLELLGGNRGETPIVHFRWERATDCWSETTFASADHEPSATCLYNSDQPQDRTLLIGTLAGGIRWFNDLARDDSGQAIDSLVHLPPIMPRTRGFKVRLQGLKAELHGDTDAVTYDVVRANTATDLLTATPKHTGTFGPGVNPTKAIWPSAPAVGVRLRSNAAGVWWGFQWLGARGQNSGRDRDHG